jgi:hypothetical protein
VFPLHEKNEKLPFDKLMVNGCLGIQEKMYIHITTYMRLVAPPLLMKWRSSPLDPYSALF